MVWCRIGEKMSELSIFIQIIKKKKKKIIVYTVTAIISLPLGIIGALAYTGN